MKKIIFLLISIQTVCFGGMNTVMNSDSSSGVVFFNGSWETLLIKAKKEKKIIFIDFYTTWCAPCKVMDKKAFPNSVIGKLFNDNFISYKVDAEKGVGVELAKTYSVDAYPTSIYLSPYAALLHRSVGYDGINNLVEEANVAISKLSNSSFDELEKQYKLGNADPLFLRDYLLASKVNRKQNSTALIVYLNSLPRLDWNLKDNIELIIYHIDSLDWVFDYLVSQTAILINNSDYKLREIGRDARIKQFQLINYLVDKSTKTNNEQLLDNCIQKELEIYKNMTGQTDRIDSVEFARERKMDFYYNTKQFDKYKPLALLEAESLLNVSADLIAIKNEQAFSRFINQTKGVSLEIKNSRSYKSRAERIRKSESDRIAYKLNGIAKAFYENETDTSKLATGLACAMKAIGYSKSVENYETGIGILIKINSRKEAVLLLQEAIAYGKQKGEDVSKFEKMSILVKGK